MSQVCVVAQAKAHRERRPCLLDGAGGTLLRRSGVSSRVIAAARAHLVALVVGHFDANAVIAAIDDIVCGSVGDRVLIAELVADILEGLVQVVHVIGKERAASGFLGDVFEDFVAFGLEIFPVAYFGGIGFRKRNPLRAGADGVDDNAGALGHFDGFRAGVLREIVLAVADENHDAADDVGLIAGRTRRVAELLFTSFVAGVVDGGAAAGAGLDDLVAQQAGVVGKGLENLRLVIEGHDEGFIFI